MSASFLAARPLTSNSARDLAELNQLVDSKEFNLSDKKVVELVKTLVRSCLQRAILDPETRVGLQHRKSLRLLAAEMNDIDLLTKMIGYPLRHYNHEIKVDLMHEAIEAAVKRNDTRALAFLSRNYPEDMRKYCHEIEDQCYAVLDQSQLQKKIEDLLDIVFQAVPEGKIHEDDFEGIFGVSGQKASSYTYGYLLRRHILPDCAIAKVVSFGLVSPVAITNIARLLGAGYPIDGPDANGRTALFLVYRYDKSLDVSLYLLESGARRDVVANNGNTLLHSLVDRPFGFRLSDEQTERITRILLQPSEHGKVDIKALNEYGESAFYLACKRRSSVGLLQLLKDAGADLSIGVGASSPLHVFLSPRIGVGEWKDVEALRILITPENINAKNKCGYTPLGLALKHLESNVIILTLLESGADATFLDAEGNTELHRLAQSTNSSAEVLRIIRSLLSKKNEGVRKDA